MKVNIQLFYLRKIRRFILTLALVLSTAFAFSQESHPLVIVTFGNSTTASRKTIEKVYAVRLHEILTNAGIENKVVNAGIPGSHTGYLKDNNRFKIPHGMDRFDTAVLAYHPDWVTINFGINDSWQDGGKKGQSRISFKEYKHNLSFFINGIRQQGGKVILLTPNPIGKKYNGFHERRLKKYMNAVRHLAKSKSIPLINTWKIFPEYVSEKHEGIDALLLDGIHPNDLGHKLIAEALSKIIINSLK
ncbi:MAG TPA: GDSL-type esterase/lipase family protein [Hanamia sp.]|nr:GDSL-type esterase/lipase family protein [Hanamia sp.]